MGRRLELPSIGPSIEFLRALDDPIVELQLADTFGDGPTGPQRERLESAPVIEQAFETQRPDGSWGDERPPLKRLLPTLWMAKALGELGLGAHHERWMRAVDFVAATGNSPEGVFSLSGKRDGVLSCYVGTAGLLYRAAARADLVDSQIEWITMHQEVADRGVSLRADGAGEWAPHLKARYGGCMSNTTCLIGLLRVGRALQASLEDDPHRPTRDLVASIREAFLRRRVMFRTDGSVLALGVLPKNADSWLQPTFPTDWRVDLIEAIDFLGRSGSPDARMQEAVDCIVALRLPDGSWPLHRSFWPRDLPRIERRSTRTGSPLVTLRVVKAFHALGAAI